MSTSRGGHGQVVLAGRSPTVNILEARISVAVAGPNLEFREVEVVIDTGFSGWLTLPVATVREMNLPAYRIQQMRIANNRTILMTTFRAVAQWQGRQIDILVYQTENPRPLLGMAMLEHCRLTVDMQEGGPVVVTPLAVDGI